MHFLKILLGLFALLLAWVVVFRSGLVFKFNAWMRERIFSDQFVLFSGKRVAVLLLVLGAVSFFSGLEQVINIQQIKPSMAASLLEQARRDFKVRHYTRVINRCKVLVRSNPQDAQAWELLAMSWHSLGEKQKARQAAESLLRLNPQHPFGRSILGKFPQPEEGQH